MAKKQAGKVQGTDADLRRMTTAQARERLRCVPFQAPGFLAAYQLDMPYPFQMASFYLLCTQAAGGKWEKVLCSLAPSLCRNYGLTEDEIQGLGRWTMIDMVRGRRTLRLCPRSCRRFKNTGNVPTTRIPSCRLCTVVVECEFCHHSCLARCVPVQVRQLASAAAQDGTVDAAAVKFVRHQKTTLIELQRRAAEKAQQILEKQVRGRHAN